MGLIRPATPGFITTLAATVLLAVVSFNVPYFKSIYFLEAGINTNGISGNLTLGTLGYCLEFAGNSTCTSPRVGYEFDPNKLLGNDLPIQIPQVVVKWLTYALVLHVVGFGLAGVSAIFGLLAHIREMSMTCFSSCISGFAAFVTLVAFIFDLVFFFVVKARINKVEGGSATIGSAVWLTLAAWILLFVSGCVYGIGRCCISNRSRGPKGRSRADPEAATTKPDYDPYADTMRLNAIKAEDDRKARQAAGEVGLPTFQEYERAPLRSAYGNGQAQYLEEEEDDVAHQPYSDAPRRGLSTGPVPSQNPSQGSYPGGFAGGAPGTRAIDNYYSPPPALGSGVVNSTEALVAAAAVPYPPRSPQQPYPTRQPSQGTTATHNTTPYRDPYAQEGSHNAYASQSNPPYGQPAVATYQPQTSTYPPNTSYDQTNAYPSNSYYNQPNPAPVPASGGYAGDYAAQASSNYHDPYSQSAGHSVSRSPSQPHPIATGYGQLGTFSPISPSTTRQPSLRGPRAMPSPSSPIRERTISEQPQHQWNPRLSDEQPPAEAPPQYNTAYEAEGGPAVGFTASNGMEKR